VLKFPWLVGVMLAALAVFAYNRANPAGVPKPNHSGAVTSSGAGSQSDAAGAASAVPLPDMSHPFSYGTDATPAVTYHSDLGSGAAPDGSTLPTYGPAPSVRQPVSSSPFVGYYAGPATGFGVPPVSHGAPPAPTPTGTPGTFTIKAV
jgi:hypothetical protein